ncbi:MAG: peptidylprolyl isomerase [SAR202 cluster bacterium Casp-Chloro-G4]|nr:peptidylprolyl isomerase [Chloroflexota bacterium]MDA1227345.1 peptidylprolyl isomerase [Chloroflexota bacterium]PKB61811.1 MAG: peptidylprolyl isomerase [SAR202 cluster bacterium Casp-Chloro-G4]
MAAAQDGDTVKVHYVGTLDDGSQFDSSRERQEPLEFTIGLGQMIPGFEKAVLGMERGDALTVTIPAEEAYGPKDASAMMLVERANLPNDVNIEVGLRLQGQRANGATAVFTVVEVASSTVTLDGNHPLAGRDLTFEIELVEIM